MFEKVIAGIVEQYVTPYIANFDSKSMNLGIWKGDIRLNDLILAPDMAARLGLPVNIIV